MTEPHATAVKKFTEWAGSFVEWSAQILLTRLELLKNAESYLLQK